MEKIKSNTTLVGDVLRHTTVMTKTKIVASLSPATKTSRFQIDMPIERLEVCLLGAYRYQVSTKGGEFKDDEKTLNAIHEVAECLCRGRSCADPQEMSKPLYGLMFCGNVGNGKTTMMFALKQCLTWLRDAKLAPDYMGYVVFNAKDIRRDMKGFMTYDEICRTDCLGIDDLGGESIEQMVYGSVHTPIVDLLEKRYDRRLFTVVTTNLSKEERRQRYGERLFDRFHEMFRNVVFKEGSYR